MALWKGQESLLLPLIEQSLTDNICILIPVSCFFRHILAGDKYSDVSRISQLVLFNFKKKTKTKIKQQMTKASQILGKTM